MVTLLQEPVEPSALRSRMEQPVDLQSVSKNFPEQSTPESKNLLEQCFSDLESYRRSIEQIQSEVSDIDFLGFESTDAYLEHTTKELGLAEAENLLISREIDVLTRTIIEDSAQMENDLDGLKNSFEITHPEGRVELQDGVNSGHHILGENHGSSVYELENYNFEILELDHWIEKSKITLRSLQNLDCVVKRIDTIGQIEAILCDVKVIEFEESCIRVSLKTYIPTSGGLLCRNKIDCVMEPSVKDHELLIEVMVETLELKDVKIFPNDISIGDIVEDAKSMRQLFYGQSPLEWLVRKVQHRIFLWTLRRLIIKDVNRSRHLIEYSDRDEIMTAHLVGGIDAFIKVPQSWPGSSSSLKLISLKKLDSQSGGISLGFLCKVEELANSLDVQTRSCLLRFVEAIEEILIQQMHLELQPNHPSLS